MQRSTPPLDSITELSDEFKEFRRKRLCHGLIVFVAQANLPVPAMPLPARWHLPREQCCAASLSYGQHLDPVTFRSCQHLDPAVTNHTCSLAGLAATFAVNVHLDRTVPLVLGCLLAGEG